MYNLRYKPKTNTGQERSSKQSQKNLQNIKLIITVYSHQNKNLKISEAEFCILASHKDLVLATEPSVTILKELQSAWNLINNKLNPLSEPSSSLDWHADSLSARFYRFTVKLCYFLSCLPSSAWWRDKKVKAYCCIVELNTTKCTKQLRHTFSSCHFINRVVTNCSLVENREIKRRTNSNQIWRTPPSSH